MIIKEVKLADGKCIMNVSEQELKKLNNIVSMTIMETMTKEQFDIAYRDRREKDLAWDKGEAGYSDPTLGWRIRKMLG